MNIEKDIKEAGGLGNLLANKSWCKAVWGESYTKEEWVKVCDDGDSPMWRYSYHSLKAFQILQQEGEEACIKYIKETMV